MNYNLKNNLLFENCLLFINEIIITETKKFSIQKKIKSFHKN